MSSAKKYIPQYTRDDYRQWQGDWQLIEGIAVSMSPSPLGPHERAVARLTRLLGNHFESQGSECEPYAGLDWIVSNDTIVRPDVMVVCGEQPDGHLEEAPVLTAEVLSPSTWQLDTESKRQIYKDNGVLVYLIIDTDLKTIEAIDYDSGDTKTLRGDESATIRLSDELSFELIPAKIFG
jgi:Uma2 family endonuclease